MTFVSAVLRRRRLASVALLAALCALVYSLVAGAATPIPFPEPLVKITTKSGNVTKVAYVPIGGAPIPLDVDGPAVTGILEPDIDVSIGLVALDELPSKLVVPNVVVTRNALAVAQNRAAPPLDFEAEIVLRDLNDSGRPFVNVKYGFKTPPGTRMPQRLSAKLVGPIGGGFIDPLQAKIESPGYSGPLDIRIAALTADLDAKFNLNFDSLPESIFISEDPREDGLDVQYAHNAPVADVHLDAHATLRNRTNNELLEITGTIERLPQYLALSNTNTEDKTKIQYSSSSALQEPDVSAMYRDFDGDGNLVTDAKFDIAGLPFRIGGEITTVPDGDGGSKIDAVDFAVEQGDQIDGVDFEVRNFSGPAGPVPAPSLMPEQHIAMASRYVDGKTHSRTAGRLLGIRSAQFELKGDKNDIVEATTDLGDGVRPLRAVIDIDDRDDPSVPDEDDQRLSLDATVSPLPEQIHAIYDPSDAANDDALRIFYESPRSIDIDAKAEIAQGPGDGCGAAQVTCATARVDDMPTSFEAFLPSETGTDFVIRHNGTAVVDRPDVRAVIDRTDVESQRTWADVRIDRVPPKVDGRMDTKNEVLRAAEFHGCDFNFAPEQNKCVSPATAEALGRVQFTVRDHPDRGSLPPREDTAKQFVSLIKRDERMEATGRVDEVRNVVFRQRDDDEDGEADGTLGALVDAGTGEAFDAVVDDVSDFLDPEDDTEPYTVLGKSRTKMRIHVDALPQEFTACVRESAETAPPDPGSLSKAKLLEECDRTNVLGRAAGELDVTPLSINYTASSKTKVTARIDSRKPNLDDEVAPATDPKTFHDGDSVFETVVDAVPAQIRTDVISPVEPKPADPPDPAVEARKLELDYQASEKIDRIDFAMESRRTGDLCKDPRPRRKATCLSAVLTDLPSDMSVTYEPGEEKTKIDFRASPPTETGGGSCSDGNDNDGDGQADGADEDCEKLSINKTGIPDPLRLSVVKPDPKAQPLVAEARITGITPHMTGEFVTKHMPTDPPDDTSLAKMAFNACPDGGACQGIDDIWFKATNTLVGDPLPPAPDADDDTSQDFTFVQRGTDHRAEGSISKFKEIGLSRLQDDDSPSPTTKIRAAFGDGTSDEKLRAFIDRITLSDPENNTGIEEQRAHVVISQAPKAINLCFRDKLGAGEFPAPADAAGADFCDKAAADKLAVQARLDESAGSAKPDIDIRELRLAKEGGTDVLEGTAHIANLAERIDVLAGKGEATDLVIEGHDIGDGPNDAPKDVASRVRFNFKNFEGPESSLPDQFPYKSLNGTQDPEADPRIVASDEFGSTRNYAKVVKDVDTMLLKGSIPNIKRIALQPRPCFPDDPRTPAPEGFPSNEVRPDYTCVNLIAAQNQPLGLAIRTLDDAGEILSMDEGFIDSVPGGDGGIYATLGKSPDGAKFNPTCGEPGATAAAGCKPTLLSIQALKAQGQSTNLQARLATGPEGVLETLRTTVPLDATSARLNYEAPVDSYDDDGNPATADSKGARVKLATGETGDAVRAGFNLDLPNYLDLDQPTSYSCKRLNLDDGPLDPKDPKCDVDDVKSRNNKGFESKDIAIRLAGANDGHLGTDVASLGRAAIFVLSTKDGKQTIITGPVTAGGPNGEVDDHPTNTPPETAPPTGAHDLGLELPGYLDARVFIRGKYEAPNEDSVQTTYYQVDGRTNVPLSLALRDLQSEALNSSTLEMGRNRSGDPVAALQLSLRNAPGLGEDAPDFGKPTFRVRAEMRKKQVNETGPYKCEGFNGDAGRTAGFGANFCIWVPGDHLEKWMDVGLNMDPPGDNRARTVDVVMDSTDYTQIDMRSSKVVDGSGGDVGKGPDGRFTPQAGLRLQPFPIGLEIGLGLGIVGGNTKLLLDGDLILKLTGRSNSRLRLSQNKGKMRLLAEDGPDPAARVRTHDLTRAIVQVRAEALFGLISENVVDVHTQPYHQPVEFKRCQFPGLGFLPSGFDYFDVAPNDSTSTAIALTPGFIPAGAKATEVLTGVSEFLAPIWCLFGTEDNALVNASHPAPAFTEPGHEILGGTEAPPDIVPPQTVTPPTPGDLVVGPGEDAGPDVTLCNTAGFKNVTVKNGGTIRVGSEGQIVTEEIDADGPGGQPPQEVQTVCTGALTMTADSVTVEAGGVITASANRTSAGPGAGAANGGGAGHAGAGGAGGGGAGGTTYANSNQVLDFGSRGGGGTGGAAGGAGGGTLRLDVTNEISVQGTIAANGGAGESRTADCNAAGAGGGSAGHVMLTANLVSITGGGAVQAVGGNGGNGGDAGGGGGGGRITVNTVDPRPAAAGLQVGGGSAGSKGAPAACAAGQPGGQGDNALGTTINHAAGVSFDLPGEQQPTYVENSVPLKIKAVKNGGGPLRVLVCRRSAPASDPDTLESALLDPPAGSLQTVIDDSNCQSYSFDDADTPGGNVYTRSIARSVSDGFHGFFAIAATPDPGNPGADCLDVGAFPLFGDGCVYQETVPGGTLILPEISQVKVASDNTAPTLSFDNANGDPDCEPGRLCLNTAAQMDVDAADNVGGVGLDTVMCSINGGLYDIPCGPGAGVPVDVGAIEGPVNVSIRATDRLGNTRTIDGPRWFTDRTGGDIPELTVTETDAEPLNGWYQSKPTISVHAEDHQSGFKGTPITFFTGASAHHCGTLSPDKKEADCSTTDTEPFIPDNGIHTFTAQSTDKLGNKSLKSEPYTMKVDSLPPTAEILLGPEKPDGKDQWYVTKPFLAFGATDPVGGSGVDLDPAGDSYVEFTVDGGAPQKFDPEDPVVLDDGIHEVCYWARDLAGNESTPKCRSNIKVDSTAPTIADPINPAAPDGGNGWYTDSPTVDGTSTDPAGAPSAAQRSGVDRVELQVDGGDWVTAAPTVIPEGVHVVRTRAFDKAGHPSPILERRVFVDRSNPSAALVTFPPVGNDRGWYRRLVRNSVAVSDGRDGSGPAGATFSVNTEGPSPYLTPFGVTDGINAVSTRARDAAGRQGALVQKVEKVDRVAPSGAPTGQTPLLTLPSIGLPKPVPLRFTANNEHPGQVRVQVVVQDVLGLTVRRLDAGWRAQGSGQVDWNGKTAAGKGVLPGVYTYRVHVTDEAGNTMLSTESKPFVVVLGLLPL